MLSEKSWKPEAVLLLFAGVFFCIILGSVVTGAMNPQPQTGNNISILQVVVAVASFHGAALVLVQFFLRAHKTTWQAAFGFTHSWKRAVLFGVIGAVLFLPVGWGLQWLCGELMMRLHHKPAEQSMVQALRLVHRWNERITMMSIAVVIVPVAEETLFRGILYPLVKQNGFPRLALWGGAVFFAAMHFNVEKFLPLFALALLLTWLYERTDNLIASITAHSLFNAANLVAFHFQEQLNQLLNKLWHFLHLA